jgi:hypothetical protein
MWGFSHERGWRVPSTRSIAAIAAGVLLLSAMLAPVSMAAAPNPSPGSATVDGDIGDWSLTADFFADMTDAGYDYKPVRAKLYLKYDCDAEVLYGLVLAQGGEQVRQTRTDEAYIAINGTKMMQSGGDFAWVNGDGVLADGYEASASLAPGEYTLRAHVLVADDSADGYTPMDVIGRFIPLVIECGGVAPTQGTPTPTPTPPAAPTEPGGGVAPTQPGGGVAPTTGTGQGARTLPPTDALEATGTAAPGSAGLVLALLGLGAISGVFLTMSRGPRKPFEVAVEETDRPG